MTLPADGRHGQRRLFLVGAQGSECKVAGVHEEVVDVHDDDAVLILISGGRGAHNDVFHEVVLDLQQ